MKRAEWLPFLTCITLAIACGVHDDRETPSLPENFDVGRDAPVDVVRALDIDIGPNGDGAPAGSGTARQGEIVYRQRCASCHGVNGEGTAFAAQLIPPVDSTTRPRRNITTHWPYAPPLLDYVLRAMPTGAAGALTNDEGYAVVAYLLKQAGIRTSVTPLDATTLGAVRMPARDRFVPDARRGGPEVR